MRALLSLIAMCAWSCGFAQNFPAEPGEDELIDSVAELKSLGSALGTWEGMVEPIFDPVGMTRDAGGYKIRIDIGRRAAKIQVWEDDGSTRYLSGKTSVEYVDGTIRLNYTLATNGFVEFQSFTFAHIEENRLNGYLSRFVHNLVIPNSSPWRDIPVYGMLTMDRVP